MPLPFRPNCLPAALGVLPHLTTRVAWEACIQYLPALLPVPLLTSEGEDPATVAIDGFPGATIALDQFRFDRKAAAPALDRLYAAYLRHRWDTRALSLQALDSWARHETEIRRADAVVTVLMGPISAALRLVDDQTLPVLGDELVLDALAKHLALRMQWHQMTVGRSARVLLQWLYEPYLDIVGSPFSPVTWPIARHLLEEAFSSGYPMGEGAPQSVRGVWASETVDVPSLLEGTLVEALGLPFPAPAALQAWAPALQDFVRRKGVIGWGIVPQTVDGLTHARVGRVAARFTSMLGILEAMGLTTGEIIAASMIMPEGTLGHLYPSEADAVLAITQQVSGLLRHSYGLD